MKTPLALFRGFQLSSGVPLKLPVLQEVVLKNYFKNQRLIQLNSSQLLVHAILQSDGKKISGMMNGLAQLLFPEMEASKEDFREKAEKLMKGWRNTVILIDQKGNATIKGIDESVEKEYAQFRKRMDLRSESRQARRRGKPLQ